MSATPMLGRVAINGERPLFNCLTRWEIKLTKTSGSVTISEALSRRSLFIGEPGNREIGGAFSNGMTFSGGTDGFFSLKTIGLDRISGNNAGPMVKPENRLSDKPYLLIFPRIFPTRENIHFGIRSIPKRRSKITVSQNKATVITQLATSAAQNPQPFRSIHGIIRNIGRVGRTNQKVPSA